jgi:hypothetical protein
MKVFQLRHRMIEDFGTYVRCFIEVRDERIRARVREELDGGPLWPQPLIHLDASFESGGSIQDLVGEGLIHAECRRIPEYPMITLTAHLWRGEEGGMRTLVGHLLSVAAR